MLSDAERAALLAGHVALLRETLKALRPALPTLPQREHIDEVLRITETR